MAVSQSMEALKIANHYRLACYAERERLKALEPDENKRELAALLVDTHEPALLSGRVADYLMCGHRYGPSTVTRILKRADIRRTGVRLRDLTPRQRAVLADAVLPAERSAA